MKKGVSFWLEQLAPREEYAALAASVSTDVIIIGGGIAGCMTAWSILRATEQCVVLVEGSQIARGASGHNAGQATTYFEKEIITLAEEYGVEKALDAQRAMYHATQYLLEAVARMRTMHGVTVDVDVSHEYSGLRRDEEVYMALETIKLFQAHNISIECMLIDAEWIQQNPIDERFAGCYTVVDAKEIQAYLQTSDTGFIAMKIRDVALANSALICESLVACMRISYADRFQVYEHTMIREIREASQAMSVVTLDDHTITGSDVVVCTNGFQQLPILVEATQNHDLTPVVEGVIGYINGYHLANTIPTNAYSYTATTLASSSLDTPPYRYLTTRPHPQQGTLICVGGEETHLSSILAYNPEMECPASVVEHVNHFLSTTFTPTTGNHPLLQQYQRHGLLGYTKSGVRQIGRHPHHPHVRYNLGCNGIGLLPSIHGGYTIARTMAGDSMPPSIFDVQL